MKTAAQYVADEAMEQAVLQCIKAYGIFEDVDADTSAVMTQFVCVVEGQSLEDGETNEYIGLIFRGGETRTSHAVGILELGKDYMMHGRRT